MCNTKNISVTWCLVTLFFSSVDAFILNCSNVYKSCECHPSYSRNNLTDEQATCFKVFNNLKNWADASAVCANEHSYLLDWVSNNSSVYAELIEQRISSLWLGIRRKEGFYVTEDFEPSLFKESNKWGTRWKTGEPQHDCVALDVTSGQLFTFDCSKPFPFVCQNNQFPSQPIKSVVCPGDFFLSFRLSFNLDRCIRYHQEASFIDAKKSCQGDNASLASLEIYQALTAGEKIVFEWNLESFWIENGRAICNKENGTCSDKLQHSFICVQGTKQNEIVPIIRPVILESFPSIDLDKSILICDTIINGGNITSQETLINFQWYKNGLPIAIQRRMIDLRFYADPMKASSTAVTRQGVYHCQINLPGSSHVVKSEPVDYFYSDISTYVMTAYGMKAELYRDYSQLDFLKFRRNLKRFMTFLTSDVKKKLHSFSWELQNISLDHDLMEVKFTLYVNRSLALAGNSLSEKDAYDLLLSFKNKKKETLKEWGDVSVTVRNADFCFDEISFSSETNYSGIVKWKETVQTRHAVSEPLCLNDWKLQTRQCEPSLSSGAEWIPFNYSHCTRYQPKVKGSKLVCPGGFNTSNKGMCYKVFDDRLTWDEALESCSNISSYLIDLNTLEDMASLYSLVSNVYWLPLKVYPNGTLFVGEVSKHKWSVKETSFTKKEEIFCVKARINGSVVNYELELCDAKLPFICIQPTLKVLGAFMFSRIWYKIAGKETCYDIETAKRTWIEANESCSDLPLQSSLIQSIHSLKEYSDFKNILPSIATNKDARWWMNLIQEGNLIKWLTPSTTEMEFVDWRADTHFNLKRSAGFLTLHGNEVQWTLGDPFSRESSICEIKSCPEEGSTYAYIEDRTSQKPIAVALSDRISNFDLRCIPSGWFLLDSLSWYKDGDYLTSGLNSSRLTLSLESSKDVEHVVSYQGYYWCSIDQYKPLKRIVSPKVLYRIPGVHTFVLALYTKDIELFRPCSEIASEKEIPIEFIKYLKNNLPQGFLHAQLRSVSCDRKSLYVHLYFDGLLNDEESLLKTILDPLHSIGNTFNLHFNYHLQEKFNTTHFVVRSTVRCPKEQILMDGQIITWPPTPVKQLASPIEMCITGEGTSLRRQCSGDFSVGAFWDPPKGSCVPVLSEISKNLYRLALSNITDENILNSSLSLQELTSNPDGLISADVQYASKVLKNIADISSIDSKVLDSIISTMDHLIEATYLMQSANLSSANVSSQLGASFEKIISNVQTDNREFKFARSNIALSVTPLNASEYRFTTGGVLENWNMNVTTLYNVSERHLKNEFGDFEAGIVLPDSLVVQKYAENASNLAVTIQKSVHFVENVVVVSPQIDVSLGCGHVYDIHPPVEMFFKIDGAEEATEYRCAYWDQQLNEQFGGWSYKGCFSRLLPENQMQCLCNHLTSFAVILELKPDGKFILFHEVTLSVITYVGCVLSILGLGVIILTFALFRKWRKDLKHKALFNLSLALMSFLIIFLAGIDSKDSRQTCLAVAVCLHYFMLASFAWMLVEAVMQYLSFVKVIGTYIPCFMQKAMAFAWGMPLIVVITILSLNYEHYISREKYCWVSGDIFYYAVAAPILAMLVSNFIIFVIILYSNTCGRPNKRLRSNQDEKKEAVTTAKAMFCVSVLLGLSWVFGFLAIDGAKLLFQYLFALSTTLQGFMMCVFFVLRQKSTRDLWFNWITHSPTPDVSRTSHITDLTNRQISNGSRLSTPDRLSRAVYKTRLSYIMFN